MFIKCWELRDSYFVSVRAPVRNHAWPAHTHATYMVVGWLMLHRVLAVLLVLSLKCSILVLKCRVLVRKDLHIIMWYNWKCFSMIFLLSNAVQCYVYFQEFQLHLVMLTYNLFFSAWWLKYRCSNMYLNQNTNVSFDNLFTKLSNCSRWAILVSAWLFQHTKMWQ